MIGVTAPTWWRTRWRALVGSEIALGNAAWLCVLAGLALTLLGIYAIDVGANPAPESGVISGGPLVTRQAMYLCVGLFACAIAAVPHFRLVRALAWVMLAVVIALLVFLLLPFVPAWLVTPRNGARGWIELGIIDFQPAEAAKIAFVLAMARYLRYREDHRSFGGLVIPALIAFVPAALITLQPDLGTALLFAPTTLAMLIAAGAKLKHMAVIVLVAAMAAPATYPILKPHQRARIDGLIARVFEDPASGAKGINYQAITAQTLAGAGGAAGVSDGKARALVKFNRLPERHNDMILSVIMTRFGLLGGLVVLGLYGVWMLGAYITAAACKDAFGRLVVVGFMAITAAQALVNIGMNLGLLPIVGLTLPLVSYGGSSMVTMWLMTGLIMSIGLRPGLRLARPTFEFDAQPYDPVRGPSHRAAPRRRGG